MKKVTINTILATLAVDNTMKWKVDPVDGNIRAKQGRSSRCYCPLTAYVKLEHNFEVDESDAMDFYIAYMNTDIGAADMLIEVSDAADFGDIIGDIFDEDDKINNAEIKKKRKLRERLLTATKTDGIHRQVYTQV